MPFALVFIGMLLIVTGIRDTYKQLGSLVYNDMVPTGQNAGFIMFLVAFGALGAFGSISPKTRQFSHYFMALIIIALVLHNAQFAQQLIASLKGARSNTPVSATPINPGAMATPSLFGTAFSGGGGTAQQCGQGTSVSVITGNCIPSITVNPS